MKKRFLAFFLCFIIFFAVPARTARAFVVTSGAVLFLSAIAASMGIIVVGSNEEVQKAFSTYLDQSPLKVEFENQVSSLQLTELTLRSGWILTKEFLEFLPTLYEDLKAYFGSGSVVVLDGPFYNLVGASVESMKNLTVTGSLAGLSKNSLISSITYNCGCTVSTYLQELVYSPNSLKCLLVGSWGKELLVGFSNSAILDPFTSFRFTDSKYNKELLWVNFLGGKVSGAFPCPHLYTIANFDNRISNVASVTSFGTTLIFSQLGYDALPVLPSVEDNLIPFDTWIGGMEDSLATGQDVIIWNPTGFTDFDDFSKVYNPEAGLVSGADIPGFVDRDLGWIYTGDIPDVGNPDIPDVGNPDIPDVGNPDIPGDVTGSLGGITSLLQLIYAWLQAFLDKLIKALGDLLLALLLPTDAALSEFFNTLKDAFEKKMDLASFLLLEDGLKGLSSPPAPNIMFEWWGSTYTAIDFSLFNSKREVIFEWIRGFTFFFLAFYNINFWYKLIRGGSLFDGIGAVIASQKGADRT